jgi:hypothetical protein
MPGDEYEYGSEFYIHILEIDFKKDVDIRLITRTIYQFCQKNFKDIKPSRFDDIKYELKRSSLFGNYYDRSEDASKRALLMNLEAKYASFPHRSPRRSSNEYSNIHRKTENEILRMVIQILVYENILKKDFNLRISEFLREWSNFLISLKPLRLIGVGEAGSRPVEWDGLDAPAYFNSFETLLTCISEYYYCEIINLALGGDFLRNNIHDIFSQIPHPKPIGLRIHPDGSLIFGIARDKDPIPNRLGIDFDKISINPEKIKYKIDLKELVKTVKDAGFRGDYFPPIPVLYAILIKEGILRKTE